jgi:hypothetical protein
MTIESCTTTKNHHQGKNITKKFFTFTAYSALVAFGVITTITVIGQNSQKNPTGTYLSPLPTGELAQENQPNPATPTAQALKTTPELINLAQNYLDKAFTLAKASNQTEDQKSQIMQNLDQSLSFTTQAINQEPRNPNPYILRAQILTAVSNTNPSALAQAQKDLETAQGLSQGQPITLPESINPLNLLPDQQAIASSDLILAAPQDAVASTVSGELNSNSFTTTALVPAGETEVLIKDSRITSTSYIYLIPESQTNASLFVKAKGQGQFTLAVSTPSDIDLTINYYIITP